MDFEVYSGAGGFVNAGIVSLTNGKVGVIDALALEDDARELARRAKAKGPVEMVIITHEHGDHLAACPAFDCPIISSTAARDVIMAAPPEAGFTNPPSITFKDELLLHLGEEIIVRRFGGHCPGESVVYFPERKLLFTGDLVFNRTLPWMGQADFKQWLSALRELAAWGVDILVPGHGPVGGKELLTTQAAVLEEFMGEVNVLRRAGESEDAMVDHFLKKYDAPQARSSMIRASLARVPEQ
jgi:cyclase